MSLTKYKLTKEGEQAAKLGHRVLTTHKGTDYQIRMATISDEQAAVLEAKGHPFVTKAKESQ